MSCKTISGKLRRAPAGLEARRVRAHVHRIWQYPVSHLDDLEDRNFHAKTGHGWVFKRWKMWCCEGLVVWWENCPSVDSVRFVRSCSHVWDVWYSLCKIPLQRLEENTLRGMGKRLDSIGFITSLAPRSAQPIFEMIMGSRSTYTYTVYTVIY